MKKPLLILVINLVIVVIGGSIFLFSKSEQFKQLTASEKWRDKGQVKSYQAVPKTKEKVNPYEVKADLQEIASSIKKAIPNEAGYTVVGNSVQGRGIKEYIFGQGSETIFLFGGIHGGVEKSSSLLLDRLVTELHKGNIKISSSKRVVIIPRINPDGYYARNDKLNARGVNLNINFSTTGWKTRGGENNYFAGNFPFSEPESRVLRDEIVKYNPSKIISFHSKGSLVNPESQQASKELARWYSNSSGYSYYYSESWNYPGTATRWFCETTGRPAITVELSSHNSIDWNLNKSALVKLFQ